MPTITCDHCGAELVVPEDNREPWAECQHCHGLVVNPAALQRKSARTTFPNLLGGVFLLTGVLVAFCGGCPLLVVLARLETWAAALDLPVSIWLLTGLTVMLIVAGVVLLHGDDRIRQSPARAGPFLFVVMSGAAAAGLVAVLLLVLIALNRRW
jgi:hypothetical protein